MVNLVNFRVGGATGNVGSKLSNSNDDDSGNRFGLVHDTLHVKGLIKLFTL